MTIPPLFRARRQTKQQEEQTPLAGQHTRDEVLENLQLRYDVLVDNVEAAGVNPGVFDAIVPIAVHVDRASTAEQQVEELLKSGKAFSASGQWNMCDSRIGNAGVTLIAQKRQLA